MTNMTDKEHDEYIGSMNTQTQGYNLKHYGTFGEKLFLLKFLE